VKERGFDYYIEKDVLNDYKKKPLKLRLQWLYQANVFRKSYPREVIEKQERLRKAEF